MRENTDKRRQSRRVPVIAAVAVADMAMLHWPQAHIATLADWAMAQVAAAVRTPIRAKARRASA